MIYLDYRCCDRFAQLSQDRTLWKIIDFRAKRILPHELNKYKKFLQPMTISLAIRGGLHLGKYPALTQSFFSEVRSSCNQLKELIIEEYYINGDKVCFKIYKTLYYTCILITLLL